VEQSGFFLRALGNGVVDQGGMKLAGAVWFFVGIRGGNTGFFGMTSALSSQLDLTNKGFTVKYTSR
jgi:hypothetical protein